MQLGMIGLGRMGANMVRRLMKAGHECVVYDVSADAVKGLAGEGAIGGDSLDDFVGEARRSRERCGSWCRPRSSTPRSPTSRRRLAPGDTIIDGGNCYYRDDVDRAERLQPAGIHYVDVGTSGGVFGLERGYCLMIGGEDEIVERLDPIFATLAPGVGDRRAHRRVDRASRPGRSRATCTAGPNGAGHFTKMVHNGIEYGLMAAYAEGLNVLKKANIGKQSQEHDAETTPLQRPEVLPVRHRRPRGRRAVAARQRGRLSWLLDLTAHALDRVDPELTEFSGRVSDTGEGRWTILAAVDDGVPVHVLDRVAVRPLRVARRRRLRQQGAVGDAQGVRRPRREDRRSGSDGVVAPRRRLLASGRRSANTTRRSATSICATCSPTTPIEARASPSSSATCTSTTRRTGSPPRRCRCWSRSPRPPGCASASTRCSAASTSTSPRTAPCCTSRCACRATRRSSSTAKTSSPTCTPCSTRWPTSPNRVRSGDWKGFTGKRDPQRSSTSASAAPTSVRRWRTTRCATSRDRDLDVPVRVERRRQRRVGGDARSRRRRDAVHRGVEDVHDDRDDHQREVGAVVARRAARATTPRWRNHFVAVSTNAEKVARVRHRHRQHVRVLGLGRRALQLRLRHRAVADDRHRPRQLPRHARRVPRDGRALPHRAVRAQPAGAAGLDRALVPRLLRRAEPRRAAVQPLPGAVQRVPAAARHGVERQVGRPRRQPGRRRHRPDRVGHAGHQRPARVLPADPPGHDADPVRLHRLRCGPRTRSARITTC